MSEIQAVLFDYKSFLWTPDKARYWLKKHNLNQIKRVHRTEKYLRYRLTNPAKYKSFITKTTKNGIHFIIGFK